VHFANREFTRNRRRTIDAGRQRIYALYFAEGTRSRRCVGCLVFVGSRSHKQDIFNLR
jgi:hypothetical protein